MGFGQTKFGAASTPAIEFGYSNTIGFGFNTYKAAGDGSPFSKLATDSSSSKAATSISGVGSAPLPAWNKSIFGSGWSFGSKTNNTPSEVGKFSFARAAAGPQAQSQAPNSGTGSQSEDALKAAMTNSSTPSAVATAAKDPAGASSLEMPAKEPDTAKGELSSTVSVELHIIEPVEKSESGGKNCVISSLRKTHNGESKRMLHIVNNDSDEVILDTALMKTVGFLRPIWSFHTIRGIVNDGKPFKCIVECTDKRDSEHLDRLLEQALTLYQH